MQRATIGCIDEVRSGIKNFWLNGTIYLPKFIGMVSFFFYLGQHNTAIVFDAVLADILLYSCRRWVELEHGSKAALLFGTCTFEKMPHLSSR